MKRHLRGMEHRLIVIRGMEIHVWILWGTGKVPLLFINGMRRQQGIFDRVRQTLSATTITFDFPENWNETAYPLTMAGIADFIADLVQALGYKQIDLAGVSWGGAPATMFALHHSYLLRKLILVATLPNPMQLLRNMGTLKSYFLKDYGGKIKRNPELLRELDQEAQLSPGSTDRYRGRALMWWSSEPFLVQIPHSTLALSGAEDRVVLPRQVRKFLAIPHCRVEEIEGDGHVFIWSSAAETGALIEAFLREPLVLAA